MKDFVHETSVPNIFGTRDEFCGRQFFHRLGPGEGDGLGKIPAHYIIAHFVFIIITSAPPQIIRL